MMNRGILRLLLFVSVIIIANSCNQISPHRIPKGSIDNITPYPTSIHEIKKDSSMVEFFSGKKLRIEGLSNLGVSEEVVKDWLLKSGVELEEDFGTNPNLVFIKKDYVRSSQEISSEDYELIVQNDVIIISAYTEAGLFYGFTTLRLMMPRECEYGGCSNGFFLPEVVIQDGPAFSHRGLLLDCCRHFMKPEFVMKMIDNLALHKMNVLHWHLTEDQGWRIAIDAFPKLTNVGAWRTELDGTIHGGFYSKDQIRQIIQYAQARNVEIIPEIELPGHSRAALSAYPYLGCTGDTLNVANRWGVFKDIYCAGNDSTLAFLETVFSEVCELFPSKRIHIGGDEAPKVRWRNCDKCTKRIKEEGLKDEHELQTWFIERIAQFLKTKGKTIIGWDEILEGGLPKGAVVQSWRGMDGAIEAVKIGTDVIVSPTSHCYLDYPLSLIDLEKVYSFNPIPEQALLSPGKIIGGECNMWTEHTPQEMVESKVFPRAIALAEVLWTGPDFTSKNGAYSRFTDRLSSHLERLSLLGIDYGMESVPVHLSLGVSDENLYATLVPEGDYIRGYTHFYEGNTTLNTHNDSVPLGKSLLIDGGGVLSASIIYRGRYLPNPELFYLDGHRGVFHPVALGFVPSPNYSGGGDNALADGRLGSLDFHDGAWQAVQSDDITVIIDLEKVVEIDSLFSHFYRYQDAWIFTPRRVAFSTSLDGNEYKVISEINLEGFGLKNDNQEIITVSSGPLKGIKAQFVKLTAENIVLCPDWHAASSEPSWLFCDEFVVRGK
ncbi:MAG: beta-N-acetylhexosaminidase [Bacteroidetes bacterium]|nr:MAG: beta-N-acetylhexosaminidase [Bacteroidota bacterium]